MTLRMEGDVIKDVRFMGQGCAISRASASLMTGAVKELSKADAERLFERVHKLVTEGPEGVDLEALGKLAVLSGVNAFPAQEADVELVWEPPWDPSRMSDVARLQLGWM